MEFLPGFAWPVPRAFASAVAACRFEQGDVLFDAAGAYEAWKPGRPPGIRFSVQVLDPPRTARLAPVDAEGNRFASNWSSPVTCEVGDRRESKTARVQTSQGRLFTCLWRGDPGLLREAGSGEVEDLPLPTGSRDLQKHVPTTVAGFQAASGHPAGVGTWFVFVVDVSSEASLAKARDVDSALSAHHTVETFDRSPAEAGVPAGDGYHPALRVRAVWVEESRPDVVRGLLKGALYGPAKAGPDRFKLERHGVLVDPAATTE